MVDTAIGAPPTAGRAATGTLTPLHLMGGHNSVWAWRGTLYPDAGELVVGEARQVPVPASIRLDRTPEARRLLVARHPSPVPSPGAPGPDSTDGERAARRAKGRVRRYGVSNRLTRLVTLTCADQTHDPRRMRGRLSEFQRQLRERHPDLAYLRAVERHESGALHAHYGVSKFVDYRELRKLWRHGFVDVRKIRTKRGGREDARAAARYLSKYVTKDPVREGLGGHRYEVRQGFQPRAVLLWADSQVGAESAGILEMGGEVPAYAWSSSGTPEWNGPPASFLSWL